jgi:hypothetical protein
MAKKIQKKAVFGIRPAFYSIVLDIDFCDALARFIKKNGGTGMIAEFGENVQRAAVAYRNGVSIDLDVIEKRIADASKPKGTKAAAPPTSNSGAVAEKAKRERLANKAKQLHAKGKSFRAIGKQLGFSAITAARYCKK